MRGFVVYSFDLKTQVWTRLADMTRDRSHFKAVTIGDEVFAVGTHSLVAAGTIEKLSLTTQQWSAIAPLPQMSRTVGAAAFKGLLRLMGGVDDFSSQGKLTAFKAFHTYDASADAWTEGPSLLVPRYRHAAVEFDGRLWVAGGRVLEDGRTRATNSVEVFSEEKGCWEAGPAMLRKRDFHDLFVIGGHLFAGNGTLI